MVKKAFKLSIAKLYAWFNAIHESYRLANVYNNPRVKITGGMRIEEYFTANFPHEKYSVAIGHNVHFKKYCHLLVFENAILNIGANVFFNNYCSINCLDTIAIGENTQFGEGVKIYDHNHAHSFINGTLVVEKAQFKTAPVTIGANCWIGSNVTILKGVTIGNNVIIGANNLIYTSVADNTIVKTKADYIIES